MLAAENIFRKVFGQIPVPRQIEHQGKQVSLSEALTLSDDRSASPAMDFKCKVVEVLKNHSLNDAIAGVFENESSESSAKRVINGATLGGRGEVHVNRKDYAVFTLRKLKHMNQFFGHWETMERKHQSEIMDAMDAAILGDEYKLRGRLMDEVDHLVRPVRFSSWPVEVCERAAKAIKVRLNKK